MKNITLILILFLHTFVLMGQGHHSTVGDFTRGGYDADLQAWIDEIDGNGDDLPSTSQLDLLNTMVGTFKSDGVWSGFDGMYIIAQDGSAGAGKVNLIDPSAYECTDVDTPTWVSDEGIKSRTSTNAGHWNSNFDPTAESSTCNYQQNDAAFKVYMGGNDITAQVYQFGQFAAGAKCVSYISTSDRILTAVNYTSNATRESLTIGSEDLSVGGTRFASAGFYHAYDDTYTYEAGTSTGVPQNDLMIGGMGSSGTGESSYNGSAWTYVRVVWFGKGFSLSEMADIDDAIETYLTNR